ncbi:hypothetical protein Scep_025700 [Stephania cephalantha]|uniref:3-beta hydroxysteroid dehydrogenase/isomerase domain-containing protein n=1 Tax=Stephania cephalantha TaxID=152367 RepID=A0AAP0HRT8_9MAGN
MEVVGEVPRNILNSEVWYSMLHATHPWVFFKDIYVYIDLTVDSSKVGLLQSLTNAETKLKLFKADIYNPDDFEQAIQGCRCIFHVTTPLLAQQTKAHKVKSIAESFMRSQTVRKLIYTAIVVAASPLKEDGSGFKDSTDEDCWTPIGLSFAHSNDMLADYVPSKTLTEKEALSYNDKVNGEARSEVVTRLIIFDDFLERMRNWSSTILYGGMTMWHKEIKANSFGDITHASRMSATIVAMIIKVRLENMWCDAPILNALHAYLVLLAYLMVERIFRIINSVGSFGSPHLHLGPYTLALDQDKGQRR